MKNYCHICGSKYEEGTSQPWVCSSCKNHYFENPSPTVDLALFNEFGEILLAERAEEPNKGQYDLPGGFLEVGETAEEGLYREAQEELGLKIDDFTKPIFIGSYPTTYSFSKEARPILIFVFAAKLISQKKPESHDDVASTRYASLERLGEIDFSLPDYHPAIIQTAFDALFTNKTV